MKTRFIFNPHSGRNARRPWLADHIRAFIVGHRLDAALVTTAGPGHATLLARAALSEGCDRVIAVGGDGTMNEIAQALLHTPAALGLVPCGSGNGLALHLGIPTDLRRALALAADAATRTAAIDTGVVNGHPFFNAMGVGFDADISHRFNRLIHRSLPAYARTGFIAFRARRDLPVTLHGAGRREKLAVLLVAIANSDQYGNRALIAPGARVDDGQLDLIAVRPVGFPGALPLVARLFLGRIDRSPRVLRLRAAHFVIELPGPGLLHTDGETHAAAPRLEIAVRPRSLRLLVPRTPAPPPPEKCHLIDDTLPGPIPFVTP